jgi:protein-S-isoprenylcysteine O-methyltransferase Ste14
MTEQNKWRPKLLPPHLFFATALLMLGAGYAETGRFGVMLWPLLITVAGVWLAVREKNRFVAEGTSFFPGEAAHKLVTWGAYRYTRNPMYLGMVLALVGLWPLTGGLWPALPLALFIALIQQNFIRHEEAMLTRTFGEAYLAYRRKVRRWI